MLGSSATAVLASGEVIVAGGLTSIFTESSGSLVVCGILKATADCPARTSHKYRPSSTNFVSFSASLCCSQAMISSILLSTNRARLRSSLGSIGGFLVKARQANQGPLPVAAQGGSGQAPVVPGKVRYMS